MDTTTQTEKVTTSIRVEADVYNAIAKLAAADNRPSQANMIEHLLKTHTRVKKALKPEAARA